MLCQFINKGISKGLKVSTRLFQMGDDLLKGNILPKSATIKNISSFETYYVICLFRKGK